MRDALAGDAVAYRALLNEAKILLSGYFARRLGHDRAADVDDLVQETLLALHARRATYETGRPFTVWFYAIARYKLVDHLRRHKLHSAMSIDDVDLAGPSDLAESVGTKIDIERLLDTLPEQPRALIRQMKLEGQTAAAIAARNGMTETAVKVGVHRGMKALIARFRQREPQDVE